MTRVATHRYVDPLDQVWLAAAANIGLRVSRSPQVYASTAGDGSLRLGDRASLDPDDCVAQMILHELCHSLIEGPESFDVSDWGLDNTGERDTDREHACLRLQAALTAGFGLRHVLAPTTDHRAFYDRLDRDPLLPRRDPTVVAAVLGLARADKPPWGPHLFTALEATAGIAREVSGLSGVAGDERAPSLWQLFDPATARHPSGLFAALADDESRTCGNCTWHYSPDDDDTITRCHAARDRVEPTWQSCAHWEAELDCQQCAACCRAAYHSVTVPRSDPVVTRHPELIVDRGTYVELRRAGDRCAALGGGDDATLEPYACQIYADRPMPCREFEMASDNCLTARQRVGLSR